jgi:hypothetical protein
MALSIDHLYSISDWGVRLRNLDDCKGRGAFYYKIMSLNLVV